MECISRLSRRERVVVLAIVAVALLLLVLAWLHGCSDDNAETAEAAVTANLVAVTSVNPTWTQREFVTDISVRGGRERKKWRDVRDVRRPLLRISRREGVHVVVVVGALWSKKRIWQRYRFAVWYLKKRSTV